MPELAQSKEMVVHDIPMGEIYCDNDFNCRGHIPPHDVITLAKSILANKLQQPIVVQPWAVMPGKKYRIVSGHRRYTAHILNDAKVIQAIVKEGLTQLEAKKLNLEENLKRKDLNILQEAKSLETFVMAGWTAETIANELGQSRGWVQARQALLKLPPEVQQEAAAGFITQDQVKQLATLKSPQLMFDAVKKIKTARLKGEKGTRVVPKKAPNPLAKKERDREEIFKLQEKIQEVVGNNFATRCLAWAAGEISDFDIERDLKEYARSKGINYQISPEILARMNMV